MIWNLVLFAPRLIEVIMRMTKIISAVLTPACRQRQGLPRNDRIELVKITTLWLVLFINKE
jgi:hypothetical protein